MSFRTNDSQQLSFSDTLYGLTPREQKALQNSWAKVFAEDIFPNIDEQRFSVLYSDKASRPNTPVNVIVGVLIIKELFGISDDMVVENLMLDPRYQYALHTTSFEEQPLSDRSLTRFRLRCYNYEQVHGVDLLSGMVKDLAQSSAKMMKIDGRIRRMDSLMVEANIRKLSRMELIYRCISGLVKWLHENGHDDLIESLEHYYDPNDFNKIIYHSRDVDSDERIQTLLDDADKLIEKCDGGFDDVKEYELFLRCISEQTIIENGKRRLKTKEDGTKVLKCPAGYEPKSSHFIRLSQTCAASFDRDLCANCPYQDQCKPKIFKRVAKINVSKKSVERAKTQAEMKTDRFKLFYRIRNGVETIPSILKNQFNVNRMPVRGLTRGKFFFGCKVAALNFRKLFNYRKGLGHYAQNPLLG